MIIEHTPDGVITHVVFDPVPQGLSEVMDANGIAYLNLPPTTTPTGIQFVQCDIMTDYILDGQIAKRPTFDTPDQLAVAVGETISIPGLPDPVDVTIDGETHVIEGGVLELTADMPAQYLITIEKWPYMPQTVEVIVNAA